nr:hypothetical protein [uncultured Methanoregula sp.]
MILIIKNKEKQYADILDQLWKELSDLMGEYFDFSSLDGVNDWKNEYWKKLTHLLFGLYLLQAREEIIESESTADMKAPFSLTGGSHAD